MTDKTPETPQTPEEEGKAVVIDAAAGEKVDDTDIRGQFEREGDYRFQLDIFEGPLDLLLYLIKVNELDVNEVALSKITGQYLEHVRLMETLDLEMAGDYLVVAATLINIKLRSILPDPEAEEEEDGEELDDLLGARQLMQQLIEYRKFKEAAQKLGQQAEHQSRIFFREVALPKLVEAEHDPVIEGDLEKLIQAFMRVIKFVDRKEYHAVNPEEFHVEDKVTMLRQRLFTEKQHDLFGLFGECRAKLEMIVLLMALLELCKLKEVRIRQGETPEVLFIVRRDLDDREPDEVEYDRQNDTGAAESEQKDVAPQEPTAIHNAAEIPEVSLQSDQSSEADEADESIDESDSSAAVIELHTTDDDNDETDEHDRD